MKYLKRFNESNSDDFYLEINGSERMLLVKKRMIVKLKIFERIKNKLFEIFKDCKPRTWSPNFESEIIDNGLKISLILKNKDDMFIDINIHILPDEWFIVDINCRYNKLYRNWDYYKCDQLEGLYRLLEDKSKSNFGMKYFKRFNESNSDDFYLEINRNEWDILASKRIDIDDSYNSIQSKISELYKDYSPEVSVKQKGMRIIVTFGYNSMDIGIDILPDEWFLVHINCGSYSYTFYKCDQLEGLYRLLEDKSKNNFRKGLFESVDNRNNDEKKEDIEDILIIEEIFEDWKLLTSRYFNQSGSMVYEFQVECKSDKKYLHRDLHDYNKYYNAYIFDREVEDIRKRINHTRLYNLGCMVDIDWYGDIDQNDPYWEGGVYNGEPKYKAIIRIKIIEPSWWKGKSIPFTDISDKEAGII